MQHAGVFDDGIHVMAGDERNRPPCNTNSFYAWKPKVTLLDGFSKDCLNVPILFFDTIHRRIEDEFPSIDHQDVVGHLLHFRDLM